jgi:hypothetical protein
VVSVGRESRRSISVAEDGAGQRAGVVLGVGQHLRAVPAALMRGVDPDQQLRHCEVVAIAAHQDRLADHVAVHEAGETVEE